ncbi:hypothetical protein [Vibrio phage phiKT1024]|nr:hypothetical protein [Vibrio phage phiKT1024]
MKLFFKTRELARQHPLTKSGKGKAVDCGTDKPIGKRWAIEVPLKSRGGLFKGH